MAHQSAMQLRVAEDKIGKLEAEIWTYKERAERAEEWLRRISHEIDKTFPSRRPSSNSSSPRTTRPGSQTGADRSGNVSRPKALPAISAPYAVGAENACHQTYARDANEGTLFAIIVLARAGDVARPLRSR